MSQKMELGIRMVTPIASFPGFVGWLLLVVPGFLLLERLVDQIPFLAISYFPEWIPQLDRYGSRQERHRVLKEACKQSKDKAAAIFQVLSGILGAAIFLVISNCIATGPEFAVYFLLLMLADAFTEFIRLRLMMSSIRSHLHKQLQASGLQLCPQCAYDLRAATGSQCPECGASVNEDGAAG